MLKLLKIKKYDAKYNKTLTFLLNVTFITFIICLWISSREKGYYQPNTICSLRKGESNRNTYLVLLII